MKTEDIPQAPDIERAVLCAMILEPDIIPTVLSIGEDLFYNPQYRFILKAIDEIFTESGKVDQLTLTEQLCANGELDKVGGEATIAAICGETMSVGFFNMHLETLKKKAGLRKLLNLGKTTVTVSCDPKADPAEIVYNIETQISDIKEYMTKKKPNLTEKIRNWISVTSGDFFVTELDKELNIVTERDKASRRKVIQRICEDGLLERASNRQGHYRSVDNSYENIDVYNAPTDSLPVKWPMEIEKHVIIYPGNIIIIAGEQNVGKTTFLLDFARLNMKNHKIRVMNSEMGDTEFRLALDRFEGTLLEEWKSVQFIERSDHFNDLILSDAINIIDFMEIYQDHYKIGAYIAQIHKKLNKGIAVIALQKPPGRDEGRGGSVTLEKPRLYLSMSPGKLKIVKAKSWSLTAQYSGQNPNGLEIDFKLVGGFKFIPSDTGWHRP
ncbi:DnaB-like helicase N-terminal domain-containing protein [Candidatus Latescibacterota bacterium]